MIVTVHFFYLLFTVGGALAIIAGAATKWEWIRNARFRVLHLFAVVLVAVEALLGIWCPLTIWEIRLRQRAGQQVDSDISFVARLFRAVLFYDLPDWFFLTLYVGFALFVVGMLFVVPPVWRSRK